MSIYHELHTLAASAIHRSKSELSMESTFEDQGIDSIDLVEILLKVEDRFGIYVPDGDVVELRNLAQLATWLDEHLQN